MSRTKTSSRRNQLHWANLTLLILYTGAVGFLLYQVFRYDILAFRNLNLVLAGLAIILGLVCLFLILGKRAKVVTAFLLILGLVVSSVGLYGVQSIINLISPHRLDFQAGIKVEGKSLKQYWRPAFDKVVEEEDWILSLASSEFEQVFSPQIQKKLVRVTFMEEKDGKRRVHSTISKKGRGRLVSVMAKQGITELAALQQVTVDGFSYQAELSDQLNLVFVRKTN